MSKAFSHLDQFWESLNNALESQKSPFTRDFWQDNIGMVFLYVFLLYGSVMLRYEYNDSIARLNRLREELADARYTSIARWGELTQKNKPDIVRSKISSNCQLETSTEPPYILK